MLNILGKFIPQDERILLIEDTSEIQMAQQNLVRFEARQPQNGLPAVTIRDLLKSSSSAPARQNHPRRDSRGRGVRPAATSEHRALWHVFQRFTPTSAKQALARFTSCVLQSGVDLPYRAIKTNIADSLNVVIQVERRPGRRYISEVLEINSYDPDADLFDYCAMYVHQGEKP